MHWARAAAILFGVFFFSAAVVEAQEGQAKPLSLSEAIEIVLEKSPLSEVSSQGVVAAEEERKAARGEFLPKLKTGFDFTVLNEVPTIEIPAMPPVPGQSFQAGSYRQLSATTSLEQPLFTGLALLSQYRLAGLSMSEAEVQRGGTRQELILKTHEAYFGLLVAEKLRDVANLAVTQLESHAEVARQFYETGMIPKNDLLKVLVQLADTKRKRIQASHQLDLACSQFNILLRRSMEEPVALTETLSYRPYERALDECLQLALRHHPELLISDLQIQKAGQSVRLAQSGWYPHFALVGSLTHEDGGFADSDKVLSATLHAEWSVWEWGSKYYKVKSAESQRAIARARHTQITDTVQLQVRQAYLMVQEWKEAISVAEASIEQARENFRITEEQFTANVTTSTEVLDAQTLLDQAQVNYYSSLSDYNISIARLERAMGILSPPGP